MREIRNVLIGFVLIVLSIIVTVIGFPFFLLISLYSIISNRIYNNKLENYIQSLEGKNFFCYNNRKNSIGYIENNLIPALPSEIETVFLNGRTIENSKYREEFLSGIFYRFQNYNRFPHLVKIRNGKAIDESINSTFYNVMYQNTEFSTLLTEMNVFFELNDIIDH